MAPIERWLSEVLDFQAAHSDLKRRDFASILLTLCSHSLFAKQPTRWRPITGVLLTKLHVASLSNALVYPSPNIRTGLQGCVARNTTR